MKNITELSMVFITMACLAFSGCAAEPALGTGEVETTPSSTMIDITSAEQTTPAITEKPEDKIVLPDSETALGVFVNQVGYLPNSVKRAVVTGGGRDFHLVRADTGEIVYTSQVEKGSKGVYQYSGDVVCYADFTEFTEDGYYYIWVPNGNVFSYPFNIGKDVLTDVTKATLKAFYYQRCGVALDENLVIKGAAHPICHASTCPYYSDKSATRLVVGGWHDAGDCGVYTPAESFAVEILLRQYALMPEMYGDDGNIPESGNGVPDILDEALVGLNFLLQMQDSDGGVFHGKVGINHAPVNLLPHLDTNQNYIWPKTLESTTGVVSSMALASCVYAEIAPEAAATFKEAALNAGAWINEHWNDPAWVKPADADAGGGYGSGDSLDDELLRAAVNMYLLTGEESWKQRINDKRNGTVDYAGVFSSSSGLFSAWTYLTMPTDFERDAELTDFFELKLKNASRLCSRKFQNNPWEIAMAGDEYGWGSNHDLCSHIVTLIMCDAYFGTHEYDDSIVASADYILGKNPVGYSFITGFGSRQVVNMHHRMRHDGKGNYFTLPGYMVSGPVKYAHSSISHKNLEQFGITADTPNMKCFYDDFNLYRFTESDLFRLALSSWVLNAVQYINK